MSGLTIGRVAAKTGVKVPTIRYYEQVGLMPEPERSAGNQRVYDGQAVKRLSFIAHARQLGFSLEQIRQLLNLADAPHQTCEQANKIAQQHLREIESRMKRLRSLKKELLNMVDVCRVNGTIADCRVIETLADHGKCLSVEH
ncbi:MAG: helix-turn-helix domain-containing protein [Hyphomicrobiaceae bacterium]|nr:helix-turn-helix domain-containing protein [Hyphomicrobiaceae bacterium]